MECQATRYDATVRLAPGTRGPANGVPGSSVRRSFATLRMTYLLTALSLTLAWHP